MRHFERGGYVFDLRDSGPAEGPVVVLLHGFPQDSECWRDVEPILHQEGYRTLAVNLRGVSPGARPAEVSQYRVSESVNDVIGMLDVGGIEAAHVVGHDFGGWVAWGLACGYPERLLTVTAVSTPHPLAMRSAFPRSTQLLQSWYMVVFQVPGLAERLLAPEGPMWRAMVRGIPAGHAQRYTARMKDKGARTSALNWYRALPREIARPSIAWADVSLPTLYVWGEKDPALARTAAEATARYVSGEYRFEAISAGHWIPETRPVLLASLLLEHLRTDG
jgi:pimeloyl-ACP methyl ester carboxylesterase